MLPLVAINNTVALTLPCVPIGIGSALSRANSQKKQKLAIRLKTSHTTSRPMLSCLGQRMGRGLSLVASI